jgi:hypothetical protein
MLERKNLEFRLRKIGVLACAAILYYAASSLCATFYEASGQTGVFNFAPGAKSGPSSLRNGAGMHSPMANGIRITRGKNLIGLTFSFLRRNAADIAIYDVTGKRAFRQRGFTGSFLRIDTRLFAPGLYSVVVRYSGQNYSRCFTVSR